MSFAEDSETIIDAKQIMFVQENAVKANENIVSQLDKDEFGTPSLFLTLL